MRIKLHTNQYKTNFTLAYPVILSQGGQLLVSLVDNAMVGFLGTLPLAACSFSNSVFSVFLVLIIGFSYGSTPLMGQAVGAKDSKYLGKLLKNTFVVNILATFLIVFGLITLSFLMHYMGQTKAVTTMAIPYFEVMVYSLLPFIFFLTFRSLCESISLTKAVMTCTLLANALNIILNYIFIYGKFGSPAFGLMGAGYATLIARIFMALSLGFYVIYCKKLKKIIVFTIYSSFSKSIILKIAKISIPVSFQFTTEVLAFSCGGIMVGWISEETLAAHQIALSLGAFVYMLSTGVAAAAVIRVSNQFGKKDYKAMKIAGNSLQEMVVFFMAFWSFFFIVFSDFLPSLFIQEQEVIDIASKLLMIASIFLIFDGLQTVSLAALRAVGDVRKPTVLALVSYWVISIPVGYFVTFSLDIGVIGVWIGYIVGLISASVSFIIRFEKICSAYKRSKSV